MNKFWTRIFITCAIILLVLFFSNDFGLIDIQKSAVIAAIGIDVGERESAFDVTLQIAVPDQSGNGKASNVTVKNARTMGDAVTEVNRKTGWYPSLVHCKLLLLGEKTAESDVFDALNYFLRSDFVDDSCLIAACEKRADEVLNAKSPIGELTATAVAKVLSSEAQKTGAVSVMNLRDFTKGYYGKSESGYLPCVSLKKEAQSGEGGQTQSQTQKSKLIKFRLPPRRKPLPIFKPVPAAEIFAGKETQSESAADVFDASKTMLFRRGKKAAILDTEETLAFNLADTATHLAYGNVTVTENGVPATYCLKMKISKKKQELRLQGNAPVFTFHIRAHAQVTDANRAHDLYETAETARVPEHVLRSAEQTFENKLAAVCEKSKRSGSDVFEILQKLYRRFPSKFEDLKNGILQNVHVVYDIRFDTLH